MYGKRLVVAQPHVERRTVALDEVLLEVQCLDLARRDDRLDRLDPRGHVLDPLPRVARARLEVRADARPQRLRLADVQDVAPAVAEDVDARPSRQALQLALDPVLGHPGKCRRLPSAAVRALQVRRSGARRGPAQRVLERRVSPDDRRRRGRRPAAGLRAVAPAQMDEASRVGFNTIRLTQMWTTGERAAQPDRPGCARERDQGGEGATTSASSSRSTRSARASRR